MNKFRFISLTRKIVCPVVLLLAAVTPHLYAAATVEVTRDVGVIGGPFAFDSAGFDANFADATAPEGLTVFRVGINGGGGWGTGNNGTSNYSGYTHLRFWLNSTRTIKIEIEHTAVGTKSFADIPATGGWKEISLRFDATGPTPRFNTPVNVNNVITLFLASNYVDAGNAFYSFDHIRWTKAPTSLVVFPSAAQVNPGKRRQFTVEGRDANNELVILYSSFTANVGAGSINPAAPTLVTASTLTAAGSAGSGVVTARVGAVTGTSNVTVTNANLDSAFGLVSETIAGAILTVDSNVGYPVGGGFVTPTLVDDTVDFREGAKSWKTTVQTINNQYSGWYINWGLDGNTAIIKNFSNYYDGAIRFWFKAPSQLSGNMVAGIQSTNISPPEAALSKVTLSAKYATDGAANIFDNNWHPIAIPVRELAGARPWSDLSRIKTMFSIFCVGNSNGNRDFWIDNLRWDTRLPGSLSTITVTPSPITLPLSAKRIFTARGFDANGTEVDIFPTWSTTVGGASVVTGPGATTLFTAPGVGATGQVRATQVSTTGNAAVTVAAIPVTQTYNVYSDLGAGGFIGVSTGGAIGTGLFLKEGTTGAIEGTKFLISTYTLLTDGTHPAASANWFVEETNTSRFMSAYDTGYLQFYVRTDQDLQFSIRSSNIVPGTETSKFTLSELGVPRDNNWQLVVIALADLKARDARLDFTKIQNYFTITALSALSGTNSVPRRFDIDNVKWLSIKPLADGSKIYAGLRAKQHPTTGLVLSYDLDTNSRAVTYDNALAVMAYTYEKDFTQAAAVLNSYKARYSAGGFAGFHDEYKWDVGAAGTPLVNKRTVGPNAWMLLAIVHYRNASGDQSFNSMGSGIADWMKSLQLGDGGVQFGFNGAALDSTRSTEHNFDAYAAFNAYARAFNNSSYADNATNVLNWLNTNAWTGSRFLVGRTALPANSPNSDRALDVYSWAPLALSSFTAVLTNPINGAEVSFSTKNVNSNTGLLVDGFDFSRSPSVGGNEDIPADKDAVWLEGTAHMALAYLAIGNITKWDYYLGQLGFAIFTTGPTTEGLTYATNAGTAYGAGFTMDATRPAASSMAWYLFAKNKFNPFKPFPIRATTIKRISNNVAASSVTWTVSVPVPVSQRWRLADHYIELDVQPIARDAYGVQIYTDNTNPSIAPRYVDPTPLVTTNLDSSPAGQIQNLPGQNPTSTKLNMGWRIQDSTSSIPAAAQPYSLLTGSESPQSINWFFFMDRATPAIDANGDGDTTDPFDGAAFSDGQVTYCIIRDGETIQTQQGVYTSSLNPDYIYLESDFSTAAAQVPYTTQIIIEFFKI